MANQWYVQHGGKQHGPLSSANLKKLADDGKIAPTTSVRLGTEGAWGPASRVQGLFAASPVASGQAPTTKARPASAAPPRAAAQRPPSAGPPVVPPPPPPPVAKPLARVTPVGSLPKNVKADSPPMAPKILSAVALVLGILALTTFWLPVLKGSMGWTGIVVGALGLVLGASGLTLSAMHKGSGLALGIAGTSSSLVGLVLTIVLGATFGLFGGSEPPKQIVAAMRVIAPPTLPPAQEAPPPVEPEPEPKSEPVWTDAKDAIEQGNIRARILSVKIENVRMENADLSMVKRPKPQPMLKVRVGIENITADKIVQFPGWPGGGDMVGQGVSELLGSSELGKAVQAATAAASLVDNVGNAYKQTSSLMIAGAPLTLGKDISIRPGQSSEAELIFQIPLETIEYLRLELSPAGFGGDEPLRFQIAREMVDGLPENRQP